MYRWLLLMLLNLGIVAIEGELKFVLSQDLLSWKDASSSCRSLQGSLAILDNVQLQQMFDRDVLPAQGERVWVGRYVGYTKLVTIDGCYRNQTLGVRRTKVLVNNFLVTCLRECESSPYIGLQGPMCHCIDNMANTAVAAIGTFCQTSCPGEQPNAAPTFISQCGNTDQRVNTVSVYRKIRFGEVTMDDKQADIGECIAYNSMTNTWLPLACSTPKPFICDAKRCPGPAPTCVIESTVPDTWYNARGQCDVRGAHLATVNSTTRVYFQQKVIFGDPVYWTGLHRKEAIAWSYDENLRNFAPSARCFAVNRKPDGSWEWQIDWCTTQHRFVCVQDVQNTPSPAIPVTTIRPTTRAPFTTKRPSTLAPQRTTTADPFAEEFGAKSGSHTLNTISNFGLTSVFSVFTSFVIFVL